MMASSATASLCAIAQLKSRHFRTMLRVLTGGLHFVEAHELLRHRAATSKELLVDDVNTLLGGCLLTDVPRAIKLYCAQLKATGRLDALRSPGGTERLVADFGARLEAWDFGPHPDLEHARHMRSSEVHAERASAKLLAARKRPRADGDGAGEGGSDGDEAAAKVGGDCAVDAPVVDGPAAAAAAAEESRLFKAAVAALSSAFTAPAPAAGAAAAAPAPAAGAAAAAPAADASALSDAPCDGGTPALAPSRDALPWRRARFARAGSVFGALCSGELRVAPSARSYVLMLAGALAAEEPEEGRRLFAALIGGGTSAAPQPVCPTDDLYSVMQPAMLHALAAAGIVPPAVVDAALSAPRDSPKYFFLRAARAAALGDQFGSKHGVVLTRDGRILSDGHNHRFGVGGGIDPHLRVMHSEVHALVRLPSLLDARDAEVWIVELDGAGVGYEEAVACAMCNKGLHALGLKAQHYSSHTGVRTQPVSHRPGLVCESLDAALRRTYPKGTADPGPFVPDDSESSAPGAAAADWGDPGRKR